MRRQALRDGLSAGRHSRPRRDSVAWYLILQFRKPNPCCEPSRADSRNSGCPVRVTCREWAVLRHAKHRLTDPVAALDSWLNLRGHEPGPLLTRVYYSRIHAEQLSGNTITRMIHTRAQKAGLPANRITAHSLRRSRHHCRAGRRSALADRSPDPTLRPLRPRRTLYPPTRSPRGHL